MIVNVSWEGITDDCFRDDGTPAPPFAQGGVWDGRGNVKIAFACPEDGADLSLVCMHCDQPCEVVEETRTDRTDRGRYAVRPLSCGCKGA